MGCSSCGRLHSKLRSLPASPCTSSTTMNTLLQLGVRNTGAADRSTLDRSLHQSRRACHLNFEHLLCLTHILDRASSHLTLWLQRRLYASAQASSCAPLLTGTQVALLYMPEADTYTKTLLHAFLDLSHCPVTHRFHTQNTVAIRINLLILFLHCLSSSSFPSLQLL